jgi:hypothetical protein
MPIQEAVIPFLIGIEKGVKGEVEKGVKGEVKGELKKGVSSLEGS